MPTGVPLKYPYTITAKLAQFPYRWYWKNSRYTRFLFLALGLSMPLFYKIHKGVNSPGNVQQWAEIRKNREHDVFAAPSLTAKH